MLTPPGCGLGGGGGAAPPPPPPAPPRPPAPAPPGRGAHGGPSRAHSTPGGWGGGWCAYRPNPPTARFDAEPYVPSASVSVNCSLKIGLASGFPPSMGRSGSRKTPMLTAAWDWQSPVEMQVSVPVRPW
jgi:hypothetical protein